MRTSRLSPSSWQTLGVAALAAAAICGPAGADTVTDLANDFLTTFTGTHNGDLDVISVGAFDDGTNVTLTATLNGDIGTTAGEAYVFGINRGGGLPLLTFGNPSVGAGVNFDAVAVLLPGGGSFVDLLLPTAQAPVALSDVTFSGANLRAVVPLSDLPANGFSTDKFLYNLWPRDGLNTMDNGQISDFAPDASSFSATVPEPAAWALLIAGFGLAGAALRRRMRRGAAVAWTPRSRKADRPGQGAGSTSSSALPTAPSASRT